MPRLGCFAPGKETRYPLYKRLGGPQGRYGRCGKSGLPTRIRSPDCAARSALLYRLSYSAPHGDDDDDNDNNNNNLQMMMIMIIIIISVMIIML
jgi:hypothetical protein